MATATLTPPQKALPAHWYQAACKSLDKGMRDQAFAYQQSLTKPPGSLGQLEAIAVELAAMQGQLKPQINSASISIFAADHGVAAEGVSAFPQAVTAEMVRNFAQGGAAVSVLARHAQAHFEVVNVGTVTELEVLPNVIDARVAAGTANFCQQPAMTSAELEQALQAGAAAAERAQEKGADIFIGGEMGIANTTSATALAAALLAVTAAEIAGAGTGLDEAGIAHKVDVIEQALALHRPDSQQPLQLLQCLGGFEIAGLCGAYMRAAQLGVPVLVDGFISTVAALVATRINPECRAWMLFSHQSHEQGHQTLLTALKAQPLLAIGMRLGEASGAALVIPLIQAACRLHGEMATFAEADVSDKA